MKEYELTQPIAYKIIETSLKRKRLANAYLIEDNGSKQGLNMAYSFCNEILGTSLELTANALVINPDGNWIKKEQIDEIKEKFATKAIIGNNKVYIINGAEKLNLSACSALLKFLEEPDPNITAILVTENTNQVLDTIKSRCIMIPLKSIKDKSKDLIEQLKNEITYNENIEITHEKIEEIVNFTEYVDLNKKKTILHLKKLLKTKKIEKDDISFLFNVMLIFYKDVLEYKTIGTLSIFKDYKKKVATISVNNEIEDIINKIKIIIEVLDDLKYNVNIPMEIDKFLLKMEVL